MDKLVSCSSAGKKINDKNGNPVHSPFAADE